jgi:hypothetical protein
MFEIVRAWLNCGNVQDSWIGWKVLWGALVREVGLRLEMKCGEVYCGGRDIPGYFCWDVGMSEAYLPYTAQIGNLDYT